MHILHYNQSPYKISALNIMLFLQCFNTVQWATEEHPTIMDSCDIFSNLIVTVTKKNDNS